MNAIYCLFVPKKRPFLFEDHDSCLQDRRREGYLVGSATWDEVIDPISHLVNRQAEQPAPLTGKHITPQGRVVSGTLSQAQATAASLKTVCAAEGEEEFL